MFFINVTKIKKKHSKIIQQKIPEGLGTCEIKDLNNLPDPKKKQQ